jgi:phosphoglycerol transferase MdoB-like AlkP superfamily enzyme
MKNLISRIPAWIIYLAVLFLFLLLLFPLFRYALFKLNFSPEIPEDLYSNALSLGLSYDTMVASYLLAIPSLSFFLAMFLNHNSLWFRRGITIYFSVVSLVVFLACSADIPYYIFTGSRLNDALLMWTDTPGAMMEFVFGNSVFYLYLIVFLAGTFLSVLFLIFLQRKLLKSGLSKKITYGNKTASFLIVTILLLIGIRGGWRVRPIAIRDAFVTNYPFVNMLPLNPLFSFFDSMAKINMEYLDNATAVKNARRYLNITGDLNSPIVRNVSFPDSAVRTKPNIVLVLMESMSAEMTALSSSGKSFTPYLDSISDHSISFSNFYTSGMHTCNGLYGVLYSMPSVPGMHPLSNVYTANQKFYGMADVLRDNGYSTNFFCTHYEEFDNMGFFLRNNGFDNFFSRKDYPDAPDEGSFGVSDETLYDFAFHKLNEFSNTGKPFFTALLTISTHEPPVLPKKTIFKPKSRVVFEQIYEYADWALENFIKRCSGEKWFDNTIFVFLADHGCNMPSPYAIPLSYHHSPFIIYSPALIKETKQIDNLAIQMDVFPTLMDFLKIPYTTNTLGVNLFKDERPFAFFCKDYLVGCLDKKHFLVIQKFGGESLHDYRSGNPESVLEENKALADSMKTYTYSMLETAQWMLENRKISVTLPDRKSKK